MRTIVLLIAAALFLSGCAQGGPAAEQIAVGQPVAQDDTVAVTEINTALDEALVAAKSFGQKYLGHYLKLNQKKLAAEGFTAPAGVTVKIFTDHKGVCLTATHAQLPESHAWHTASVNSRQSDIIPGATCARKGGKQAEQGSSSSLLASEGEWICLLPKQDA